jgi:hypothetical protein
LPDIFPFSQPSLENPAPSGLLYKLPIPELIDNPIAT